MKSTNAHIAWSDEMLLGFTPMDLTHREFVDCVASLQLAKDEDVLSALKCLQAHIERHFDEENQWMIETDYPVSDCHVNEHKEVQESVQAVVEEATLGNYSNVRRLANELEKWFPGHATYLDSALAHWMCKRSLGGKPVVLRRNLNLHET